MTYTAKPQSVRAIFNGIIDNTVTDYRGYQFRSRLEADFARHLDIRGIVWRYEPLMFGPPGKGYLPDFEIPRPTGPDWIEVKPRLVDVPLAQERMAVIWETYPDAALIVACGEECRFFSATAGGPWSSWVDRWHH